MLFVVDGRAGVTPGDARAREILRRARKPVLLVANKLDDPRGTELAHEFLDARPRRAGRRLARSTATARATCSTPSSSGCPAARASRVSATRRSASRSSAARTSASRASLNALLGQERADRLRHAGHDARRDRHGARARRPHVRPRRHGRAAPQAQAPAGRSSTTPSCARSRPPNGPMSRSSSSTRPRASSSRTCPSPTSRARRNARRSSCSRSGTSDDVEIEDVRRAARAAACASGREIVTTSATTGRGIGACSSGSRALRQARSADPDAASSTASSRELREDRQPPSRRRKRPQPPLRHADECPPAALPLLRQRPEPRDARLRRTGSRTRCASGSGSRACRSPSTSSRARSGIDSPRARRRRRRRLLGHGVRVAARASTGTSDARLPRSRAGGGDRRDRAQPALPAARASSTDHRDDDRRRARRGRGLVVVAVPSSAFADVVARCRATARCSASRRASTRRPAQRLSTLVEDRPVACLSGPNIAEEIAAGPARGPVIASEDEALAVQLQDAINSPTFRVYVNADIVGVELCAAAKNVIALAAGGVDGLGLGDNAKAGADHARPRARWRGWARRPAPAPRRSPASRAWAT